MPKKTGDLHLVSTSQLAGIIGKSSRAVRTWIDEGMPIYEAATGAGKAHKLNAPDCIQWLIDREKAGINDASRRYEVFRADKMEHEAAMAAIELDEMKGSVVEVPTAIGIFSERVASIRSGLSSLPARASLAVAAATTKDEVRNILEDEIRSIMDSLASSFIGDEDEG